MNQFQKICQLVILLLVAGVCLADDYEENDPLNQLSRAQRRHFQIYQKMNEDRVKKKKVDDEKVFVDLYSPVVNWCREFGPKFNYESMKAGDKAKSITNERKKTEWLALSSTYAGMATSCTKIVKSFDTKEYVIGIQEIANYAKLEREAISKGYKFPRRQWITELEARNLLWRLAVLKNRRQGNAPKDNQQRQSTYSADDSEPRQGRVRNNRRGNNSHRDGAGRHQRGSNRTTRRSR